mgnify:FL=1
MTTAVAAAGVTASLPRNRAFIGDSAPSLWKVERDEAVASSIAADKETVETSNLCFLCVKRSNLSTAF